MRDSDSDIGDDSETTPQLDNAQRPTFEATRLRLRLGGSVGLREEHPSIPYEMSVLIRPMHSLANSNSSRFEWPLEEAIREKEPIRVDLPPKISKDFENRGWGDHIRSAVVVALSSEADGTPLGIVILGLNTRRHYDIDYRKWVDVLRSSMSSLLNGSIAREEEVRRAEYVDLSA